jgi:hypothetical protein
VPCNHNPQLEQLKKAGWESYSPLTAVNHIRVLLKELLAKFVDMEYRNFSMGGRGGFAISRGCSDS